jgi:hypothetical protein
MHLAENLLFRNAAIVKFEDRIGVAAMRDIAVAVADVEALCVPLSTKKAVIFLRLPRGESSSPDAMKQMAKPAMSAWLMKCLVPLSTQSSPS